MVGITYFQIFVMINGARKRSLPVTVLLSILRVAAMPPVASSLKLQNLFLSIFWLELIRQYLLYLITLIVAFLVKWIWRTWQLIAVMIGKNINAGISVAWVWHDANAAACIHVTMYMYVDASLINSKQSPDKGLRYMTSRLLGFSGDIFRYPTTVV